MGLKTCLFVWLVGFLKRPRQQLGYIAHGPQDRASDNFYVLPHMRQSWETMTSVSAGHIIQTQPVGSGRPQRESNPGHPHQESRALLTELLSYRAPLKTCRFSFQVIQSCLGNRPLIKIKQLPFNVKAGRWRHNS